jgi:hypothetical protein
MSSTVQFAETPEVRIVSNEAPAEEQPVAMPEELQDVPAGSMADDSDSDQEVEVDVNDKANWAGKVNLNYTVGSYGKSK